MNKLNNKYYLAAFVFVVTFLVYLPSLHNGFVTWDDGDYVYKNTFIRSFSADFFRWAFLDFHASNWHPLTWISHALDYAIWGLNPLGHHLTGSVLHAFNAFLVVLLAIKLVEAREEKTKNKDSRRRLIDRRAILITGTVTGLLFGLHPLHVESVAWVSERKDLLCSMFFLLSIMAYVSYRSYATYMTYILSLGLFTLALLSKPMAVTLPLVLLILDWYPLNRIRSLKSFGTVLIEKIPFFALSLGSSVLTILAQKGGGAIVSLDLPLSVRIVVAAKSFISYMYKMIMPLKLVPFYPYPKEMPDYASFEYGGTILLLFVITSASVMLIKKEKLWLAAWGYYVVTLIPVIGIVQVGMQSMADRYTYLPAIGIFFTVGAVSAQIWSKAESSKMGNAVKGIAIAAAIVICATMSYLTLKQIEIWKDGITLWSYAIEKEPHPAAYNNRGIAFKNKGEIKQAIEDFNSAIALNASYADAYNNRAAAFGETGETAKATEDFNKVIALKPNLVAAYLNRGRLFKQAGQFDEAFEDFSMAIRLNPLSSEAYNNRGLMFGMKGQMDKALEDFNVAIEKDSSNSEAYNNRGLIFEYKNLLDRALEDYGRAIALNPSDYMAYFNRGMAFDKTGKKELAAQDFSKSCGLGLKAGCDALRTYKRK